MAVVKGGLHGRPRGKVAGIVYGGSRSREGKVVTARELVIPSPTDDPKVVAQRLVFKSMVMAVQYLAAQCWQQDYDRAIGQLPGFQSIMAVLLGSCAYADGFLLPPPITPLGNLYCPTFAPVTHGSTPGSITVTWGTELGTNGTDADKVVAWIVEKEMTIDGIRSGLWKGEVADRVDGTIDIATGASGTDWMIALYLRGAGTALGKLSPAKYYAVKSNPP